MAKFEYPPVGFRFEVSFIGLSGVAPVDASFSEISGISVQVATEEITEGGENRFVHRLPTKMNYSPVVLKRGLATMDSGLVTWLSKITEGDFSESFSRPNMVIHLLDEQKNTLMSWTFEGVFPTKYDISGFKADANQLVIESIELQYNKFKWGD